MDENLLQFGLKAFVTLIVVVDPLGVAPSFVALTSELGNVEKRKTLGRSLVIAFGVTLFFLVGGRWLLSYLGVTVYAFAISGGILLFVVSWPMLFGQAAFRKAYDDPEFEKEYKKITGDDPSPINPEDYQTAIREIPRDPETIELYKKLSGGDPLPNR
jgi:multiple antibiotic resistance protein